MVLVDTSVWIDFLKGNPNKPVEKLKTWLATDSPVGITSLIYQEILQGVDSEQRFGQFKDYFGSQRFYHPRDPIESYTEAAQIYFRCRRQGIAPRSTVDCLIVQIAIEHELALLHNDQDFVAMARVIPSLRLVGV